MFVAKCSHMSQNTALLSLSEDKYMCQTLQMGTSVVATAKSGKWEDLYMCNKTCNNYIPYTQCEHNEDQANKVVWFSSCTSTAAWEGENHFFAL